LLAAAFSHAQLTLRLFKQLVEIGKRAHFFARVAHLSHTRRPACRWRQASAAYI